MPPTTRVPGSARSATFQQFLFPAEPGRYLASCTLQVTSGFKNNMKSLERLELGTVPGSARSTTFHKFYPQNTKHACQLGALLWDSILHQSREGARLYKQHYTRQRRSVRT